MQRILANSVALFTVTLFTSATLLFLVELIIAKMMLPKFGGTPAVWNTCMVFFQAALLAGYAYAHKVTDWLGLRRQAIAQVTLILVPLVFLPFSVSDRWTPPGDQFPGFWVLWLLLVTVGLPFFAISTSAPLLQKWFSESGHPAAKDPYFLYAASNVGSMIALLGYPLFIEPYLTLSAQSWFWLAGYLTLAALTIGCAYVIWHAPAAVAIPVQKGVGSCCRNGPEGAAHNDSRPLFEPVPEPVTVPADEAAVEEGITAEPEPELLLKGIKRKKKKGKSGDNWKEDGITRDPDNKAPAFPPPRKGPADVARPSIGTLIRWMALAFVPSSLMLGATTYLTTDIASIPLLWIIPLAIYLLSFILVFSKLPGLVHTILVLLLPVVLLIMLFVMASGVLSPSDPSGLRLLLLLHLVTLFFVSMVCHGELAHNRPAPRYLTGFFLCMSAGGVLGGLFNALAAPLVFNSVAEYEIVLVLACLLLPPPPDSDKPTPLNYYLDLGLAVALGIAALYALPKLIDAHAGWNDWIGSAEDRMFWPWLSLRFGILAALIAYGIRAAKKQRLNRWLDVTLPICLGILTAQLIAARPFGEWQITEKIAEKLGLSMVRLVTVLTFGLPVALCYGFAERPIRLGLGVAAIFVAAAFSSDTSDLLHQERSFFGVLKVEIKYHKDGTYHSLLHGTTMHGMQRPDFLQLPELLGPLMASTPLEGAADIAYAQQKYLRATKEPLTYYHRTGPIGQLYETFCPPERKCNVAFIGLGTGTMASYLEPRHNGTIYEIDAAIVRIAENPKYFTYLRDCKGAMQDNGKPYKIELGDARLKLKDAPDGKYRLIVVDAFSSDAIPIHLITKEAVQLYVDKLAEGGVVAIHISNRHLGLDPVLGNIAKELGLAALQNHDVLESGHPGKSSSDWVVMARKMDDLKPLDEYKVDDSPCWRPVKRRPSQSVWTDDFSNILSVLRWWRSDDD